mmetsp:Transcript_21100/g.48712  ORF Transcript_21100/g.48712 Transcript_21100/m.48712 type:complete len:439 (-) Transcript_21100:380-1696(-)|eukprot:CAMPEP_0116856668 /NCGR_PEP_ID=MMETSP0418-20121206/20065_1 /TAXON_ID=1158023 /ORGANISM="Astrosyne radiata, Strain 13vi08-1A" /LENGTH=438 /DNA_ID=CAMNT_0004490145 /DNA_START=76 /DNA_END=1392 /DNA_ORIENTATION=-
METSSSTLVNVAEDAELRLVKLLAESAPKHLLSPSFSADCERSIVHADASGLMKLIVHDAGAIGALLVLQPADEAVSAFSLLAALLDRVRADRPEEEAGLAASLAESVVKTKVDGTNESDLSRRRIALLAALYNLRSQGTEKCGLLETMIRLASAYHPSMLLEGNPLGNLLMEESSTTRFTNLEPPLPRLATLVETWNVPPKHRRSLFQAVADGITDSVSRKQRFKLLLVETYADAGDTGEEGLRAAKDAAVGAIQDPVSLFMQQRTMLAMPAIQALANKPETKVLYGLLTVFQEGKLEDYHTYIKDNGGEDAVLVPWGLSPDACVRYMRILSMCSLAAEHEEIPYTSIAQTLQLPSEDEVESWVIAAVSSGLLAAKMDQLQHKVMVERSVVRRFDLDQWKVLQSQLNLWKQNLKGILDAFKQTQQGAAALSASHNAA